MTKVNQQTMKTQYDGQYETFCRKNYDYGNSFEESLDQFGIVASIVRMSDKMKRLESLTDDSKTQKVVSESLLDTLEDLSNYAAMTACWLKGIREEDEISDQKVDKIIFGSNMASTLKRSIEMEKEFNKHVNTKVKNIDPRNYVLNMLSNIFRVVQMKLDKDDMLVPMDISDEAGLIAKAIVESKTEEESGSFINNYMCTRKDIPYELKDWIYGIIMRHFYYLKKERAENFEIVDNHQKDTPAHPMEIPEAVKQLWEVQKQQVDYLFENHAKEDEKVATFNAEFLNMAKTCLNDLFENIILCRDQNIPLPKRLTYCSYREEKYEQIAALVLTGNIDFSEVASIVNDYPNLRVAEKNHLLQSIVASAYKISDEPENEKPEFLNKKFHIPDEILEDLNEPEEERECKRTVLGMIFPFRL